MVEIERIDKQMEKFDKRMTENERCLQETNIKLERNNILTEQNTLTMEKFSQTLEETSNTMRDISYVIKQIVKSQEDIESKFSEVRNRIACQEDRGKFDWMDYVKNKIIPYIIGGATIGSVIAYLVGVVSKMNT